MADYLTEIRHACRKKGFTFRTQNGLPATIYKLNPKKIAQKVAKVFCQVYFQSDTAHVAPTLREYCVVKFRIKKNTVYIVCLSCWTLEAIITRYKANLHDGLYASGLFVVFEDHVYPWSSWTGKVLINSIVNRTNPTIEALVTSV